MSQNHFNLEEASRLMRRLQLNQAGLYMYFAKEAPALFERDGEMAVRWGIRNYAKWRGQEMRRWHESRGFPINVESVMQHWDSASAYLSSQKGPAGLFKLGKDGTFAPYDVKTEARSCPAAEVWKKQGLSHWGHVYCDELHINIMQGYDPDGVVVITENMMKGDPACKFRWLIANPQTRVGSARRGPEWLSLEEEARDTIGRCTRISAGVFYYMAREMINRFGRGGEDLLRKVSRRYGIWWGNELREIHEKEGKELHLQNLIPDLGHLYKPNWQFEEEHLSENQYSAAVAHCPLKELWKEWGAINIGQIFCEEVYPVLVKTYNPKMDVEMHQCMAKGNRICKLMFTMK